MLEWAGAKFVKLTKIQAWQELVFVLAAISNIESREKTSKLSFWWSVYILTCAINMFMLHRAIDYLLSVFGYFLVCSVINAVKHKKVTKTLNK